MQRFTNKIVLFAREDRSDNGDGWSDVTVHPNRRWIPGQRGGDKVQARHGKQGEKWRDHLWSGWYLYRVTIQLVQNLLLTSKRMLCFSICSLYENVTFVFMSTGCWKLPDVSPCTQIKYLTQNTYAGSPGHAGDIPEERLPLQPAGRTQESLPKLPDRRSSPRASLLPYGWHSRGAGLEHLSGGNIVFPNLPGVSSGRRPGLGWLRFGEFP